jgi:hypothetical protein
MIRMKHYKEALKNAIEAGAVSSAINALVGIAETLIERRENQRAADILALVIHYPMLAETRALAVTLLDDLESRVCPRVLVDARARAQEITFDDLADEILLGLAEE